MREMATRAGWGANAKHCRIQPETTNFNSTSSCCYVRFWFWIWRLWSWNLLWGTKQTSRGFSHCCHSTEPLSGQYLDVLREKRGRQHKCVWKRISSKGCRLVVSKLRILAVSLLNKSWTNLFGVPNYQNYFWWDLDTQILDTQSLAPTFVDIFSYFFVGPIWGYQRCEDLRTHGHPGGQTALRAEVPMKIGCQNLHLYIYIYT